MLKSIRNRLTTPFALSIVYLFSVQLLGLFFMFIFRLCLFIACYADISNVDEKWHYAKEAWLRSLNFDIYIASHIALIPLLILPLLALFKVWNKLVLTVSNVYFAICYTIVFALSASDIPYFKYFYRHINTSIFNWAEYGKETSNMILNDKSYWVYIFLFFVSVIIFIVALSFIKKKITSIKPKQTERKEYFIYIPILIVALFICKIGMNGKLKGEPLHLFHSYFCHNTVFNQLAINPVFFFYKSMQFDSNESTVLLSENEALEISERDLGFNADDYNKPLVVEQSDNDSLPNVVIILVESLSNNYLSMTDKNGQPLTPYLNELTQKSYYFNNFYSQGTHTNQGIVATLYSFPAIFDRHLLKPVDVNKISNKVLYIPQDEFQQKEMAPPKYHGIPNDLYAKGYNNLFFLTHAKRFDNMGRFLTENGYDKVYGQEDYPSEGNSGSGWGITDEYLLQYSISQFDSLYQSNRSKPFFGTMLTISNHPPAYYPEEFKNYSDKDDERAIAYNDRCIKTFFEVAATKEWYNNTIFIILGDHGKVIASDNSPYDIPLSLVRIPLIIHSPLFKDTPKTISDPGGQIDLYPTLMGLIGQKPIYHNFGTDILTGNRKYIYFTTDDLLGCISDNYLYCLNTTTDIENLYDLKNKQNVLSEHKSVADSMKTYSSAMVETARYLFKNNLK